MIEQTLPFEPKTKRDQLLRLLQAGGKWSKAEIWRELGIWNSGNLIMLLRRDGHPIKTEMVSLNDGVTYARYFLEGGRN